MAGNEDEIIPERVAAALKAGTYDEVPRENQGKPVVTPTSYGVDEATAATNLQRVIDQLEQQAAASDEAVKK